MRVRLLTGAIGECRVALNAGQLPDVILSQYWPEEACARVPAHRREHGRVEGPGHSREEKATDQRGMSLNFSPFFPSLFTRRSTRLSGFLRNEEQGDTAPKEAGSVARCVSRLISDANDLGAYFSQQTLCRSLVSGIQELLLRKAIDGCRMVYETFSWC